MTSSCQIAAMMTDPGAIPKLIENTAPLYRILGTTECIHCRNPKPFRAHHCSACHRCIFKMDHHCPWINNCVGLYNQKHFILLLFYTALYSLYSFCFATAKLIHCIHSIKFTLFPHLQILTSLLKSEHHCGMHPLQLIFCILTAGFSVGFVAFSLVMLCIQLAAIRSNITLIEGLQELELPRRKFHNCCKEVFGSTFSWRWFFPTKISFKDIAETTFDASEFPAISLIESIPYKLESFPHNKNLKLMRLCIPYKKST